MSNKPVYLLAALMLIFMVVISFFSLLDDSAIMDEVAHLPAGYSYATQGDMRLNPEHPPLVKDLAGLSILTASKIFHKEIVFPKNLPAWQTDINGQWNFGFNFMYQAGNDADWLLFFGRLPMLLFLLLLGFYIFKWTRELSGNNAALLALFLFSFSPTFIAHGRFVTTDVAAATGIFISCYYFWRWLKNPSTKSLVVAGLVFGLAQLAKFSVFLLVPFFCFIALVWFCLKITEKRDNQSFKKLFWENGWRIFGGTVLIFFIGFVFVVWPVYFFHVLNYPAEKQQADIKYILSSYGFKQITDLLYWLAGVPVFRALAQYGFGLAMVTQRASGGNTTYFLGQISAAGSSLYFPFVYLVKETVALHFLTLVALFIWLKNLFKRKIWLPANFGLILKEKFPQFLMLAFIAFYWLMSVRSSLNIGVRHILPSFPFIFILVAGQISAWLEFKPQRETNIFKTLGNALKDAQIVFLKYLLIGFLVVWQILSVVSVYPSFLAYFNEFVKGPNGGVKYVVDSNLDWGQDLKRLAEYVKENKIQKIYVDYFGGSLPAYYLGGKYEFWWGNYPPQKLNPGDWLAVSATFKQGGQGQPAPGYNEKTGYYDWLRVLKPKAVIGHSIFVYQIPQSLP